MQSRRGWLCRGRGRSGMAGGHDVISGAVDLVHGSKHRDSFTFLPYLFCEVQLVFII
jgi:hypothetical protein